MATEYIEREAAKRELLSWAVSINHPEYLIKDDALHVIDSIPAADVVGGSDAENASIFCNTVKNTSRKLNVLTVIAL